jgi:predicted GTPase
MQPSFSNSKQVTLKVLEQIAKLAAARGSSDVTEQLRQEMEHLRSGELNVAVCGESKKGKSSLLNAFLEEPDLCPVDAPVATNAITMIRYGEKEKIVVHFTSEAGQTVTEEIPRALIRDFVTEQNNAGNTRKVHLLQIWLPNPKLKDGLVLIDTPGVGSLNAEHTAVTYGIIPYVDAVLFASGANDLILEPELEFCKRIARFTPHFLHVLTKRETMGNWRDVLKENLEKVTAVLGRPVKGVAVSSNMKLAYLQSGDEEDLELSGFAELERATWDLLAQRSEILLGRAQTRALPAIAAARLPAQTEQQALTATSAGELKALDDRLQEKIQRGDELSGETSFWVNELNRRMALLRNDCGNWLAEEFAEIQRFSANYVKVESYLKDPRKLGEMLTVDANNGFAAVVEKLQIELGNIVLDLRQLTSLQGVAGGKATVRGVAALQVNAPERPRDSFLTKTSGYGRSCTIHSMGLGTTGAVFGGILGGIIGTIAAPGAGTIVGMQIGASIAGGISGLVGAIFGIKKGIADQADRDIAGLRQNIAAICRDQLTAAQRNVSHELNLVLTNAQSEIHESLLREIQRDQKACKESAASLAKARLERQADFSGRLRELNNTLKMLDNLERSLLELAEAPAESAHAMA